ncbi:ribonuclease III domain-containing protein [Paenibacillus sanguinis]|uniref:ribonuclease III domain-containing protein n=1 Tax=Paenibacillus sanguinis TaxID=225906 RepID=UPI000366871D
MSGPNRDSSGVPAASQPAEASQQAEGGLLALEAAAGGSSPASGGENTPEPGALSPLWFPDAPSKPARLLPPLALAYIGDAVYEVAVRQHVMARLNLRPHHLHGESTKYVSAKAQAQLLALVEPLLTEAEKDVVRQGRNAKSGTIPKNASVQDYRQATAFESLIGFLYYNGQHDRLRLLIAQGFAHLEDNRKS